MQPEAHDSVQTRTARNGISWSQLLLVILVTIVFTMGGTYWLVKTYLWERFVFMGLAFILVNLITFWLNRTRAEASRVPGELSRPQRNACCSLLT